MSIPKDFDWKEYLSLNNDLTYKDEEGAKNHFINYGINEKRIYKTEKSHKKTYNGLPYDFDWKEYLSLNPDLPFANEKEAIQHYKNHGEGEGRTYKIVKNYELPDDFNWKEYILANDDLKHLNERTAAENHYILHGKNENRVYKYNSESNKTTSNHNTIDFKIEKVKKNKKEKMNEFHNYIYKHFGLVLYNDFNYLLVEKHKNLIDKYNVTDPNCKYILYNFLNTNYTVGNNNKKGFELCISLYNESNVFRICELLLVLSQNIQNKNIKSIHILFENYTQSNSLLKEMIDALIVGHKLTSFIKIVNIAERPSYEYIFNYVNNLNGKTIVSNSDIVFDNSLEKIQDIRENDFICLSRKNWNSFNNKWEIITFNLGPTDPKKYLNYFSHDTWIFHSPLKHPIKIDYLLGEMFCDSYLDYKLSKNKYDCYNLGNDINCLHVQNGYSASQEVATNPDVYHKALAKLQSKEPNVPQLIYALDATSIQDYKNSHNAHKNKFYSHPDYLAKIRSDVNYQV